MITDESIQLFTTPLSSKLEIEVSARYLDERVRWRSEGRKERDGERDRSMMKKMMAADVSIEQVFNMEGGTRNS